MPAAPKTNQEGKSIKSLKVAQIKKAIYDEIPTQNMILNFLSINKMQAFIRSISYQVGSHGGGRARPSLSSGLPAGRRAG